MRRINELEPEFYFDDFGKKSSKFQKYESSFTSNDLSIDFDDDDDKLSNASFSTVDSNTTVRNMSDDSFTKLKSSISMSSADSAIDVTPPSPFDLKKELASLRTRNNGLHEQVKINFLLPKNIIKNGLTRIRAKKPQNFSPLMILYKLHKHATANQF